MWRCFQLAVTGLTCAVVLGFSPDPTAAQGQCVVSLPSVAAAPGTTLDVHAQSADLTGLGITSFRYWVRFDPKTLRYISSPVCNDGVEFPWDTFKVASVVGDEVHVAAASSEAFSGRGCLFAMRFEVLPDAAPGTCSPLEIIVADMLPERPGAINLDGQICVGRSAQVSLTPEDEWILVDEEHTVSAYVDLGGSPGTHVNVNFEVLSGPNEGLVGTAKTDERGVAAFTYRGIQRGMDLIRAEVPVQDGRLARRRTGQIAAEVGNPVMSTVAVAKWQYTPTDVGRNRRDIGEIQVAPNPFSSRVELHCSPRNFTASMVGLARVEIYSARGRLVRSAPLHISGSERLGFVWDGLDQFEQPVPAGVYMARFHLPDQSFSTKVLRILPNN